MRRFLEKADEFMTLLPIKTKLKPSQIVDVKLKARSDYGPSKTYAKKWKADGGLKVAYRIYFSGNEVIVAYYLKDNDWYAKKIKDRNKNYTGIKPSRNLKLPAGQKLESKVAEMSGSNNIRVDPAEGHNVSHDDLLDNGYSEHRFLIFSHEPTSDMRLPFRHTVNGTITPFEWMFSNQEPRSSQTVEVVVHREMPPGNNEAEEEQHPAVFGQIHELDPELDIHSDSDYGSLKSSNRYGSRETLTPRSRIRLDIFGDSRRYIMAVFYFDNKATSEEVNKEYTDRGLWHIGFPQKFVLRRGDNIEARLFGPIESSHHNLRPEDLFMGPIGKQLTIKRDSKETTVRCELKQMGEQLLNFEFCIEEHEGGPGIGPQNIINVHNKKTTIAGKMATHGGQIKTEEHDTSNPMHVMFPGSPV